MPATQIHVHLGSVEPGTEVHLYFDGLDSDLHPSEPDEPPSESDESPEAAMLARMLASARTGNMQGFADPDQIQKVYDELIGLGYLPVAPSVLKPGGKPAQYLRWMAGPGPSKAYLNTASLAFSRRDDRAKVAGLPGAKERSDYVMFSIHTAEEVEQALTAAKAAL